MVKVLHLMLIIVTIILVKAFTSQKVNEYFQYYDKNKDGLLQRQEYIDAIQKED